MMSTRLTPIVPAVLFIADARHPWRLGAITRWATRYHTPTTVRVRLPSGEEQTRHQHQVHCLPDDAAWARVQTQRAALQQALDALADALRQLGSYTTRLAEAGGFQAAPNPLSPTVISAPDPDGTKAGLFVSRPIPQIARRTITDHTPKMLRGPSRSGSIDATFHQRDHFVCPDDAAWSHVAQLEQAAKAAAQQWEELLRQLGTYQHALADERYQHMENAMPTVRKRTPDQAAREPSPRAAPPAPRLVETHQVVETDLDTELLDQLEDEGWTWRNAKRTPDGHWHHVLRQHDGRQVRLRRERLDALVAPASAALAISAPLANGVVMMSEAEARACVSRISGQLEQARRTLLELYEREGWKALGYASWRACAVAEFGHSAATLYRQLEAAQIERDLSHLEKNAHIEKSAGTIPTAQLQPLKNLTPNERRDVWKKANQLAGDAPRTAAHVRQAVEAVKPPPFDLPADLLAVGATLAQLGASRTLQLRIGGWRSSALRNVSALIGEARVFLDDLEAQTIHTLLAGLEQCDAAVRPRQVNEARQCAARVSDAARRQTLLAEIETAAAVLHRCAVCQAQATAFLAVRGTDAWLCQTHFAALDRLAGAAHAPATDVGRTSQIRAVVARAEAAEGSARQQLCAQAIILCRQVHDGDLWPTLMAEIRAVRDSLGQTSVGAHAAALAPASRAQDQQDAGDPAAAIPADALEDQAHARIAALVRSGFAALRHETLLLRVVALALCDPEQRGLIAELPLAQLHELLIGRLFAGAWADDPAPLLVLLQLDTAAPASALPALVEDSPLSDIAATLVGVERALGRELSPADVREYVELLEQLSADLEALSAAPDVTDAVYDQLATRISAAQRQLEQRLMAEPAAA